MILVLPVTTDSSNIYLTEHWEIIEDEATQGGEDTQTVCKFAEHFLRFTAIKLAYILWIHSQKNWICHFSSWDSSKDIIWV